MTGTTAGFLNRQIDGITTVDEPGAAALLTFECYKEMAPGSEPFDYEDSETDEESQSEEDGGQGNEEEKNNMDVDSVIESWEDLASI